MNPNCWWEHFGGGLGPYYFLFVSGHFIGNFQTQLERISLNTGVKGAAVGISQLLLLADAVRGGAKDLEQLETQMFQNKEFLFS